MKNGFSCREKQLLEQFRGLTVEADDEEGGVVVGGDAHAEAVEVGQQARAEVRGVGRVDGRERSGDAFGLVGVALGVLGVGEAVGEEGEARAGSPTSTASG